MYRVHDSSVTRYVVRNRREIGRRRGRR